MIEPNYSKATKGEIVELLESLFDRLEEIQGNLYHQFSPSASVPDRCSECALGADIPLHSEIPARDVILERFNDKVLKRRIGS